MAIDSSSMLLTFQHIKNLLFWFRVKLLSTLFLLPVDDRQLCAHREYIFNISSVGGSMLYVLFHCDECNPYVQFRHIGFKG